MAIKDFVDKAIADNKVVIFSKTWCGFCTRAKRTIASGYPDIQTAIYELDTRDDGDDIQAYLLEKTGQTTVPNIFINQQHIGGSDSLLALKSKGELDGLLK
ncbi:glutaredoxin [Cristinia sonorae]|uniref:Glutaredoxin n=1 Tax=Cristinia sonorae TaxID=1940300 RepID=A0A8K0ULN9_9AGAR|nr:glutaredoxin [Cristinia sonorae]